MRLETPVQEVPSVQDARKIADLLVGAFPSIEAVLLCGSVARGDADNWSDIDLVLIGSDTELTASQLRQELPAWNDRVSNVLLPEAIPGEHAVRSSSEERERCPL